MDGDELLESIVRWHVGRRGKQVPSIGKVLERYIGKGRRKKMQSRVVDFWDEMLPSGLAERCRAVSLLSGVLKVEVEAGVYMFEMQSAHQMLLEQLQQHCPGAGVKEIKLVVGRATEKSKG